MSPSKSEKKADDSSSSSTPPSAKEHSQARSNGSKSHELEGEENEWKFKEPYRVHDKNEGFDALLKGGCHCGRVKYEINVEEPLAAKYCHCNTCQTLHGAPFQWAAILPKSAINFTKGHHSLSWYESGEKTTRHKLPCKVACEYCGSWIMDEGRNMILMFPGLIDWSGEGGKDGKEEGNKKREKWLGKLHMFYGERCIDVNDGLPKWEGMSGDSVLLDDGEGDAKVDREEEEEKMRKKREEKKEKEKEKEGGDESGKGEKNGGKRKRGEDAEDGSGNEKNSKSAKTGDDDGEESRYDLRDH